MSATTPIAIPTDPLAHEGHDDRDDRQGEHEPDHYGRSTTTRRSSVISRTA